MSGDGKARQPGDEQGLPQRFAAFLDCGVPVHRRLLSRGGIVMRGGKARRNIRTEMSWATFPLRLSNSSA